MLRIRYCFLHILWLLHFFFLFSCASTPKLSDKENQVINQVLKAPIQKQTLGATAFALSQKYNIWFETIKSTANNKGSVILIAGMGDDALSWSPTFISGLTNAGYEVIRFDQRETGLSNSEEKWKKKSAYSLKNMADDVIAILNTLKIKKAHIVGTSMGGMIAQIIALEYPDRTASLTSIMATADVQDPEPTILSMSKNIVPKMVKANLNYGFLGNKKGQIKRQVVQKKILMGTAIQIVDIKNIAKTSRYRIAKRNGINPKAVKHHYAAILNSSSRYIWLSRMEIGTLIIHGMQDPFIPFSNSKKMMKVLPNATSLWLPKMGHYISENTVQQIVEGMVSHFETIDEN